MHHILLVLISKSFGGAEVRVLTQARALIDAGHQCTIAALEGSMLHERLQGDDLPFVTMKSGRGSLGMLLELRRLMQEKQITVIDAHNVQSIFWGMWAAWLAGVSRRVVTVHSDFAAEYPGMKGKLYAGVLSLTRPLVHHTINVTQVLQDKADKSGHGHHETLIPNAVPIPAQPLRQRRHDLAGEWGFAADDFVVGIVGRLVPVKGHAVLLAAMAQLDDVPQLKLVIVGTGTLEAELKAQVSQLGLSDRVHFTGFRRDIPDIMQNLDALTMASFTEALPYVVLEAASYARPLVVTAVGGLKTLLEDGKTALLVPPNEAEAHANALRQLVLTPALAESLGLAGYEMVKGRFSTERMIESVLVVYSG